MMRPWGYLAGLGLLLALAACATTPPAPTPPTISWAELPGWAREDHLGAIRAVAAACALRRRDLERACAELTDAPPLSDREARVFIERRFRLERLPGEGLLTAYFTPTYEARLEPQPPFTAPVRPPPPAQAGDPGPPRSLIEATPAPDALAWMKPEDLFFLQVQGSGVLLLPGGGRMKAVYAGSNDQPFVGLAGVMRQEGLIDDAHSSGEAIRGWLAANRGPEADALMRQDPRYVYFTLQSDDGSGPSGTAGAPLPAGRALAVDRTRHPLGELFWIDASAPALAGAFPTYRRLTVALDTGSAIKGDIRADLYLGTGEAAGREAGRVRHRLALYQLEPR